MISIEKMWECKGKHLKIIFTDGNVWDHKYCDCYLRPEEDDEEPMLQFGNIIVNQSEIKSIEILD